MLLSLINHIFSLAHLSCGLKVSFYDSLMSSIGAQWLSGSFYFSLTHKAPRKKNASENVVC